MRKILMFLVLVAVLLLSSGCVTDKAYAVGKSVYPVVKTGVGVAADVGLLEDETIEKLQAADRAATSYDKTRTKVRNALDTKQDK